LFNILRRSIVKVVIWCECEIAPLEIFYIDKPAEVYYSGIINSRSEENARKVLVYLVKEIASENKLATRERLTRDWYRLLFLPAWRIGGTPLVSSLVKRIEDFDQRLLEASLLIGKEYESNTSTT
jgi:hypothetical protein